MSRLSCLLNSPLVLMSFMFLPWCSIVVIGQPIKATVPSGS
jgi:hypothetical protein